MPKVTGLKLIQDMPAFQKAVPSFDISGGNLDILIGVFKAAQEKKVGCFISSTPSSILDYTNIKSFAAIVDLVASDYDVPYAIHLDHAPKTQHVFEALDAGFSSVMFDGSELPLADNIKLTRQIVTKAHSYGVTVEAEVGLIGGKEDDLSVEASQFPTLEECLQFVENTQIDIFAPAIGTAHGFYKGEPNLQWDLVEKLKTKIKLPLVLHGGTGLPNEAVVRLIASGFKKINYATGLRAAFKSGFSNMLEEQPSVLKPQKYLVGGRMSVYSFALKSIEALCDSN